MTSDRGKVLGGRLLECPDRIPRQAEIVIVGGGLAGLEVARVLEQGGRDDVLVLEAGPVADLRHVNQTNDDAISAAKCFSPDTDGHFHRPHGSANRHYRLNSGLRRRLGGRSLYWHGVVLPIEPWALREPWWPPAVVESLAGSWAGGPSLYERVLADLTTWRDLGTPRYPPEREAEVGGLRLSATPMACRSTGEGRWRAYSPLDHWLPGGAAHGVWRGVRFACDAEVMSVDVRDGRAAGVSARHRGTGEAFRVEAGTVVLAAAAVENARLVIQALAETRALPEPRLGRMTDHIVQGFVVRLADPHGSLPQYLREPASFMAEADPGTRSYLRLDVHHPAPDEVIVDVRTTGEQECLPESFIECVPQETFPWQTVVRTAMSTRDHEVVAGQRIMLNECWSALGADLGLPVAPLEFEEFGKQTRTNTFVLPEFAGQMAPGEPVTWVSLLGTEDHEGGTLPLGTVLDEQHRLPPVPNVFAAGPTTFPRLGAANPSLTALALARRLAGVLVG
ncbi:GMC family oxidoreductase [Streptomyces sp. NPDC059853]|uniref:GMC family oxidoreductase n=1 Tax=Streptomyces sp. NPDC059853 TaxID=3346973 RepID=UPI00364757B9